MDKKKRKYLSVEKKWEIFLECSNPDAKIGEILRKHGLYASDLQNIRKAVKDGALSELAIRSKPGKKKITTIPKEEYERLQDELSEKEKALAELSVLFTMLKKKTNLE